MKNVGHVAAKNVLIFALASIVYYLVGFGIAFGDGGNGLVGGSGFVPSVDDAARGRRRRRSAGSATIPGAAGYLFEVVFCARLARDRLGRDGRADEALGLLRLRRRLHADLLARLALDLEPGRLAVREGDAGLRRLDRRALPGRARRARRRAAARAAHRQVRPRRQAERDPRPQHGVHDARRDHPLVRLVRLQPGLDARRRLRRRRLLRVRRAEHEHRGRRRRARRRDHVVARDQEARPLDDAERRDRRARRDHRRVRVRRAVGGDRDRLRRRRRSSSSACSLVERIGIDDPIGAVAAHGMSGVWGTLVARLPRACRASRTKPRDRHGRPLLRRRLPPARRAGARPRRRRRVHVQRLVRASSGS